MKIKETRFIHESKLKDLCNENGIEYSSLTTLINSVKTKKLLKRNNYHQQTINDIIENSTK